MWSGNPAVSLGVPGVKLDAGWRPCRGAPLNQIIDARMPLFWFFCAGSNFKDDLHVVVSTVSMDSPKKAKQWNTGQNIIFLLFLQ